MSTPSFSRPLSSLPPNIIRFTTIISRFSSPFFIAFVYSIIFFFFTISFHYFLRLSINTIIIISSPLRSSLFINILLRFLSSLASPSLLRTTIHHSLRSSGFASLITTIFPCHIRFSPYCYYPSFHHYFSFLLHFGFFIEFSSLLFSIDLALFSPLLIAVAMPPCFRAPPCCLPSRATRRLCAIGMLRRHESAQLCRYVRRAALLREKATMFMARCDVYAERVMVRYAIQKAMRCYARGSRRGVTCQPRYGLFVAAPLRNRRTR